MDSCTPTNTRTTRVQECLFSNTRRSRSAPRARLSKCVGWMGRAADKGDSRPACALHAPVMQLVGDNERSVIYQRHRLQVSVRGEVVSQCFRACWPGPLWNVNDENSSWLSRFHITDGNWNEAVVIRLRPDLVLPFGNSLWAYATVSKSMSLWVSLYAFLCRLFLAIMCKYDIIDETGSTCHIAMPPEVDRYRKHAQNSWWTEDPRMVPEIGLYARWQKPRQTDRQTCTSEYSATGAEWLMTKHGL